MRRALRSPQRRRRPDVPVARPRHSTRSIPTAGSGRTRPSCFGRNAEVRNLADHESCAEVESHAPLATRGDVHPPSREHGLAHPLGGLARQPLALRGRDAVPSIHLDECGRARGALGVVARRTALPGLRGLEAGRGLLARMGDGWGLRTALSPLVVEEGQFQKALCLLNSGGWSSGLSIVARLNADAFSALYERSAA